MKDMIKQAIKEHKLIAIVRGVEPEICLKIADALRLPADGDHL